MTSIKLVDLFPNISNILIIWFSGFKSCRRIFDSRVLNDLKIISTIFVQSLVVSWMCVSNVTVDDIKTNHETLSFNFPKIKKYMWKQPGSIWNKIWVELSWLKILRLKFTKKIMNNSLRTWLILTQIFDVRPNEGSNKTISWLKSY